MRTCVVRVLGVEVVEGPQRRLAKIFKVSSARQHGDESTSNRSIYSFRSIRIWNSLVIIWLSFGIYPCQFPPPVYFSPAAMQNTIVQDSASTPVGPAPLSFTQGERIKSTYPTVTAAFYHHAETHPDVTAGRDLSSQQIREITYGDLATRANQLSRKLTTLGVKPGDRVPLVVKRGIDMLVGIVAILSCGAQYVPLDGGVVPDSTLRFVLEQAGGKHVLCLKSTKHRFETLGVPCETFVIDEDSEKDKEVSQSYPIQDLAQPDHGCYVIYTSGKRTCHRPFRFQKTVELILWLCRNYGYSQRSGCHPQKCD